MSVQLFNSSIDLNSKRTLGSETSKVSYTRSSLSKSLRNWLHNNSKSSVSIEKAGRRRLRSTSRFMSEIRITPAAHRPGSRVGSPLAPLAANRKATLQNAHQLPKLRIVAEKLTRDSPNLIYRFSR